MTCMHDMHMAHKAGLDVAGHHDQAYVASLVTSPRSPASSCRASDTIFSRSYEGCAGGTVGACSGDVLDLNKPAVFSNLLKFGPSRQTRLNYFQTVTSVCARRVPALNPKLCQTNRIEAAELTRALNQIRLFQLRSSTLELLNSARPG